MGNPDALPLGGADKLTIAEIDEIAVKNSIVTGTSYFSLIRSPFALSSLRSSALLPLLPFWANIILLNLGKWVLEVSEESINAVWQHISKEVSSGALPRSPSAKTSTALGFGVPPHFFDHYVVCVYTNNYLDEADVMGAVVDLHKMLTTAKLVAGVKAVHYKPGILPFPPPPLFGAHDRVENLNEYDAAYL